MWREESDGVKGCREWGELWSGVCSVESAEWWGGEGRWRVEFGVRGELWN